MNELQVALRIALANTFVMYFKSHSYHWNVEGPMFSQYHDFLGELYSELHSAVDATAEQIRAQEVYAPINLSEIRSFSMVQEDAAKPSSTHLMISNLVESNQQVIESLSKVFDLANAVNDQGLANFAAGRLDIHAKHMWMIKSFNR